MAILDKLKALYELSQRGTEFEAKLAHEKLMQLLKANEIHLSAIVDQQEEVEIKVISLLKIVRDIPYGCNTAIGGLAAAAAMYVDVITIGDKDNYNLTIIGFPTNIKLWEYTFSILFNQGKASSPKYFTQFSLREYWNGFAEGVLQKLIEIIGRDKLDKYFARQTEQADAIGIEISECALENANSEGIEAGKKVLFSAGVGNSSQGQLT